MQGFGDLAEGHLISEQHRPGFAPEGSAFGIDLNPVADAAEVLLARAVVDAADVAVTIRCLTEVTPGLTFGAESASDADAEQGGLAPSEGEGEGDEDAVVGVHRIEVGGVGKANGDAELMQLIHGAEGFGVIAAEAVSAFDEARKRASLTMWQDDA